MVVKLTGFYLIFAFFLRIFAAVFVSCSLLIKTSGIVIVKNKIKKMKKLSFLLMVVVVSSAFFSCEKTIEVELTRVSNEAFYNEGILENYINYIYDDYGKLKKATFVYTDSNFTVDTIIYESRKVYEKAYVNGNDTPYVYKYYLNSKGLTDSMDYSFDNKILYSGSLKYDAENHIIEKKIKDVSLGFDYTYESTYQITDGNNVSRFTKSTYNIGSSAIKSLASRKLAPSFFMLKNPSIGEGLAVNDKRLKSQLRKSPNTLYTVYDTVFYEYNDKLNSLANENYGCNWYGAGDKNLLTKQIANFGGAKQDIYYSYNYNPSGEVTRRIVTSNGITSWTIYYYSTQTFVENKK